MGRAAPITINFHLVAFLLMAGLLILSDRTKRATLEGRFFSLMCLSTMAGSLCVVAGYACLYLPGRTFQAALFWTLQELSAFALLIFWMLFTDFRLYRSPDHLKRNYPLLLAPAAVFLILLLINLLWGNLFHVTAEDFFTGTWLYWGMKLLQLIYLLFPAGMVLRFRLMHGRLRFFRVAAFTVLGLLSFATLPLHRVFFFYLIFSLGIVLLYFSMMNIWRYVDNETGFYNLAYLRQLYGEQEDAVSQTDAALQDDMPAHSDNAPARGGILFLMDGDVAAAVKILKTELPKDSEVVRTDTHRFLFLTNKTRLDQLRGLTRLVEQGVTEHNLDHPDTPISFRSEIRVGEKHQ